MSLFHYLAWYYSIKSTKNIYILLSILILSKCHSYGNSYSCKRSSLKETTSKQEVHVLTFSLICINLGYLAHISNASLKEIVSHNNLCYEIYFHHKIKHSLESPTNLVGVGLNFELVYRTLGLFKRPI